jgi:nucleoside-diphosphate-sugar epimerase
MDNSLARDSLGFTARTSLAEGLKRTLAWYRANKSA